MNTLPIHLYEKYVEINPSIYDFIGDNKKKVEDSLVMHNNMNILTSIYWYTNLILENESLIESSVFTLDLLKKSILEWEKPDFAPLLGLIRLNYRDNELYWNKYFKKIIKAIELLDKKIDKKENEHNPIKINFEDVKHSIIENISTLKGWYNISNTQKIPDGYYINNRFFSHLWIDFYISPILITLIIDLVHNSIKYSNIWTQIDLNINQTKDWINISVSDEWFWIKEQDIEKVFEYWIRLDNVWDEEWNGIWGYKLINEINKLWWELHVKSEVWVWTEIIFKIPNPI